MELSLSIRKLQKGDEKELKQLYQTYCPHFLSFALRFVADEAVCRDIVQEVFIAFWEKHKQFDDLVSLKVFLYRSVRNRCLNELRHNQKYQFAELDSVRELDSAEYMEELIIKEEVASLVRQKIANLSPQMQRIIRLSLQGKTNQEIADELQLSINTIKTHKLKAYAQLRDCLKEILLICLMIKSAM